MRTAAWRQANSGRKRMPARTMAGHSTNAIAAMPAVVPSPIHSSSWVSLSTRSSVIGPDTSRGSERKMAMTTTLLRIGANAAAANFRRALSRPVAIAVIP